MTTFCRGDSSLPRDANSLDQKKNNIYIFFHSSKHSRLFYHLSRKQKQINKFAFPVFTGIQKQTSLCFCSWCFTYLTLPCPSLLHLVIPPVLFRAHLHFLSLLLLSILIPTFSYSLAFSKEFNSFLIVYSCALQDLKTTFPFFLDLLIFAPFSIRQIYF
jgi:hypothetical protein